MQALAPEQGEVEAQFSEITRIFKGEVDLAEVVVIIPNETRIAMQEVFNLGVEFDGDMFTFSL